LGFRAIALTLRARLRFAPLKPSGDHQVDNQKEIAIKVPDDLFSEA
jgi:hypothetical protein